MGWTGCARYDFRPLAAAVLRRGEIWKYSGATVDRRQDGGNPPFGVAEGSPWHVVGGAVGRVANDGIAVAWHGTAGYFRHFRASAFLVNKVKSNSKIIMRTNEVVEEIKGNDMVNSLVLKNTVSSAISTIDTSALFIAAGRIPNSDFAKSILTLDENGYILTDVNMKTNVDGIYAVGDVRKSPLRQILTAAADGAVAANDIAMNI